MAKRIQIDVPGVRLNETGYKTLAHIASAARAATRLACNPVPISRKSLTTALGVSQSCGFRTCAALEENGLIRVESHANGDGGQGANAYCLTALGLEVLRLADEAVAKGRVGQA